MLLREIIYKPIGVIHSPFKSPHGTPIQPSAAYNIEGVVEIFPDYVDGLRDLDGFSHIILIYHFHLVKEYSLLVKPYMDNELHGIFATRAPARPNPIGISIVRLKKINGNKLYVLDIDIVDDTPLLDIKPYVPEFDVRTDVRKIGWLEENIKKLPSVRDDGRFLRY